MTGLEQLIPQLGPLAGLIAVIVTVSLLSLVGPLREHRGLDLVMALGLLAWMVFLVWQPRFAPEPPGPVDEFVEHMGFQVCVAAACKLSLAGARVPSELAWLAWGLQVFGGGGVLLAWNAFADARIYRVWEVLNWTFVGAVMFLVAQRWWQRPGERHAWVTGLSLLLLGYAHLAEFWHHPTSRLAIAGMFIYPAALIALWTLITARLRADAAAARAGQGELQRQRIAQEVHDGVGSQLVAILASLDLRQPEQRQLALALEQCLLNLKITVDTLGEDETPDFVSGLAMLRYRIQHSLDRLGIELEWSVDDAPDLQTLSSLQVRHALRIVQEAVANVLRHAEATQMSLHCHSDLTSRQVVVSITDNGRGIGDGGQAPLGRGLRGMRRRAEEAALVVEVGPAPGGGTKVQLRLPLPSAPALAQPGPSAERMGWESV